MIKRYCIGVGISVLSWLSSVIAGEIVNPWQQVNTPAAGPPRVIGSYSGGCLQGAVSLQADAGSNFTLMRPARQHYFAYPTLRQFVLDLAQETQKRHWGRLLVGDLSQARGGPTTTGHASHQIGLDADFWFWLDAPLLTPPELENLSAPSMLNPAQTAMDTKRFGPRQTAILEWVVNRPEVTRVFVNPVIKQALCEQTHDAAWLRKLRPWWGHHYHFHVRLGCPADQPACETQESLSAGSGCGADLAWWFSPEALEQSRQNAQADATTAAQRLAAKLAKVPAACAAVLHAAD